MPERKTRRDAVDSRADVISRPSCDSQPIMNLVNLHNYYLHRTQNTQSNYYLRSRNPPHFRSIDKGHSFVSSRTVSAPGFTLVLGYILLQKWRCYVSPVAVCAWSADGLANRLLFGFSQVALLIGKGDVEFSYYYMPY